MRSEHVKRACGPSGIRLENDWASVVVDCAYGEWTVGVEPVQSKDVETFNTGPKAMARALELLAEAATGEVRRAH